MSYTEEDSAQPVLNTGSSRYTSLTSGDFDGDGVIDLVLGHASPAGNFVSLHRGNVDAIFPHSPEARQRRLSGRFIDEPFLPRARAFESPTRPDFLASGDFDNDGHWDVAAAAWGESALYVLAGDGRGGLKPASRLTLPGAVTTLLAGEINRRDALTDLVVGVSGPAGSQVLVFQGPEGALRATAEVIPTTAPPSALLLARLAGQPWYDLAVAAGEELLIVTGRDRRLVASNARRDQVGPPVVERIGMPGRIQAMAWGDFVWEPLRGPELALLLADGTLQLLDREPTGTQTAPSSGTPWRTIGQRELRAGNREGRAPAINSALLLPLRWTGSSTDELGIFDASRGRAQILGGLVRDASGADSLSDPGTLVDLEVEQAPVAAISMRLNEDALSDLVLLHEGPGEPFVIPSAPAATITVDSSADNATAGDGACTLREALYNANSDSDVSGGDCAAGAGVDLIQFNIFGGGVPATIALTAELPSIVDPLTLDGTTQGCAGPVCIVLDGSGAGIVLAGLRLAAGSSSLRGLVIQNFFGDVDLVDGHCILVPSNANIIEGTYCGSDLSGTVAQPNEGAGIRVEDGTDNIIGGTAPEAGNLIASTAAGVGIYLTDIGTSNGNQVLGNLVGTDVTGTVVLGTTASGIVINGSNNTIGGTAAAARNVVSGAGGNGIYLQQTAGQGNLILGNYVGTDITGTLALANGPSNLPAIWIGSTSNTVGGTSPGAGNLVSGNLSQGVHVRGSGHLVLGNFVGTDVTGQLPLGNGNPGVTLYQVEDCTVGGTVPGARNLISGNQSVGVFLNSASTTRNEVLGNYIGTDITGIVALPNAFVGVEIEGGAFDNVIGGAEPGAGNLISGNTQGGVFIDWGTENTVSGNLIGTDVTGTVALGNGDYAGIDVWDSDNTIGGVMPGAGNVISGNGSNGVVFCSPPFCPNANLAERNQVLGNFIGTDISGTVALGNALAGVRVIASKDNTIGGSAPGARNVISGNGTDGVGMFLEGTQGNVVIGNFIGTDVSGTIGLGNLFAGVEVDGGSNNTIGGTGAGAGNIISDNEWGIVIELADDNQVLGNSIGTQVDGTSPLGNRLHAVLILSSSSGNTIGGTGVTPGRCDGPCNRIGFSTEPEYDGVRIFEGAGTGNAVLGNSIHSSAELGIDLEDPGVTLNDPGDGDVGANDVQNYPVLSLVEATPTGVTVEGSLNSSPGRPFRLEFFANPACDPSGCGEGSRYLGFTDVSTDFGGNASFSAALTGPVSDGEAVTATATSFTNSTSEFSVCFTAVCDPLASFGQTIVAPDKDSLSWTTPDNVRFVKGDLADLGSYLITDTGELPGAVSLDIGSDNPTSGSGLYYLVRSLACGSWQTALGAEPDRDTALP